MDFPFYSAICVNEILTLRRAGISCFVDSVSCSFVIGGVELVSVSSSFQRIYIRIVLLSRESVNRTVSVIVSLNVSNEIFELSSIVSLPSAIK